MTDQRPQYGELATPEEQRRAAGLPPLDEVVVAPPIPPGTPDPQAAARLEILRALGAGEIDVAEASDRLTRLDDEVLP